MSGENQHQHDEERGLAVAEARPEVARPPLYQVLLLNDDYTPMDFVVHVLQSFFAMEYERAHQVMLHVHTRGKGVCGLFTREVAETKVTQVNELLTQMEAFDGIFVASTNLVDTLDAASLRRFDFKFKCDWLTREQRRAMLTRICGNGADVDAAFPVLESLDQLVPGDFANVLRQLRVTGEPAAARRVVQLLAQEVAMKPTARSRRIGFLA